MKICDYYETDVYKLLENVDNVNFGNAKFKGNQYVIYPNNSTINYSVSPEFTESIVANQKKITNLIQSQNNLVKKLFSVPS